MQGSLGSELSFARHTVQSRGKAPWCSVPESSSVEVFVFFPRPCEEWSVTMKITFVMSGWTLHSTMHWRKPRCFIRPLSVPCPSQLGAAQAEPPASFPKQLVQWWCQDEPEDGNIHPHFSMALTVPSSPSAWVVMVMLYLMEKREPVPAEGAMKVPAVPFSHS